MHSAALAVARKLRESSSAWDAPCPVVTPSLVKGLGAAFFIKAFFKNKPIKNVYPSFLLAIGKYPKTSLCARSSSFSIFRQSSTKYTSKRIFIPLL